MKLSKINYAFYVPRFSCFDMCMICIAVAIGREYGHWLGMPFVIVGVLIGGYLTEIFAPAAAIGQQEGE